VVRCQLAAGVNGIMRIERFDRNRVSATVFMLEGVSGDG
jgi:hypothetical protein